MRCRRCGLCYVGRREHDFTFSSADPDRSRALSDRVHELGIVDHAVEDAEGSWRRRVHEERLEALRRHGSGRRLLDVGCASGEFLQVAAASGLEVEGVEPDPVTSGQARSRGLRVRSATLAEARLEDSSYDALVPWHVLEHLPSPSATLAEARRWLRPGGMLAVETPAIDTPFARLFGARWRQLIPDHYFFFSRRTLTALLERAGFTPLELRRPGKPMSVRFFADRVRRISPAVGSPLGSAVSALRIDERTLRVNVGDIVRAVARRR